MRIPTNEKAPIIERLIASIEGLQLSVESARSSLESSGKNSHVLPRLDQYEHITYKQLLLVKDLEVALKKDDANDISRLVTVINSLSLFVKSDSQDILQELSGNKSVVKSEELN